MKKSILLLAAFLAALVIAAGCRSTVPVNNISDATITTVSGHRVAPDDVKRAILGAGTGLGWAMREVNPGHIVGTLNVRSHMAMVDIHYNTQTYSITYRDSNNLNYADGNIHQNYNGWIQNLDNAIRSRVSVL